jgi:hypothetical protein
MDKINELYRAQSLLRQALAAATNSLSNSNPVQEAKGHMKKALSELDHAAKTQLKKKQMTQNQFEDWWGKVVSGTAATPMSAEAHARSLSQLNAMIGDEKKKLDELEQSSLDNSKLLNE